LTRRPQLLQRDPSPLKLTRSLLSALTSYGLSDGLTVKAEPVTFPFSATAEAPPSIGCLSSTPLALIIIPVYPPAETTWLLALAPADLAGFLETTITEALTLEPHC
jgi:hypothetical protein